MRSIVCSALVLLASSMAAAQDFEMLEPTGMVAAQVEIRPGRMEIFERSGERLYFSREPRYDSLDGRFLGYFNLALNRIIRFPRSGSGQMQSADLDDIRPHYRMTRRLVRPAGGRPVPGIGLGAPGYVGPGIINPGLVGPGYAGPGYVGPGYVGPGNVGPGYIGAGFPQSVLIDSRTIVNPPLPPVRIQLRNGGPRDLQVGVVDLKERSRTRSLRIAPGGITEVTLERDAGARLIQNFRVVTPLGDSITKEIVTDVVASVRYEIVVHEWQIQSVAIDRTAGAGENPIEDINFSGKGIGRFPLPPGAELQSGIIDVFQAARAQGNNAAVAPILAGEDDPDMQPSPLERAILEAQQNAQRGR